MFMKLVARSRLSVSGDDRISAGYERRAWFGRERGQVDLPSFSTRPRSLLAGPALLSDRPHWPRAGKGLRISWSKLSTHEMSCCRDTSIYLACSYSTKIRNLKACLIDRNKKKREETLHDLTCNATVHWHMKTADVCHYPNAKIIEISVGFFRPKFGISFGGGPIISANHNLLTVAFLSTGSSLPYFFSVCREFGRGIKTGKRPITLG